MNQQMLQYDKYNSFLSWIHWCHLLDFIVHQKICAELKNWHSCEKLSIDNLSG